LKIDRIDKFDHLVPYIDYFEMAKMGLIQQWVRHPDVVQVFHKHRIAPEFFGQYFGVRIVDYAMGVIRNTNQLGYCPVVGVMLIFFEKKQIALEEIFIICTNLKNTLMQFMLEKEILMRETLNEISRLIDQNFLGVIHDYMQMHNVENEMNSFCSITQKEEPNTYYGNDNTNVTSALHYLQAVEIDLEMIDDLGAIEKDTLASIDLTNAMDNEAYRDVIILLNDYIHVVKQLLEFQELAYTLTLLVDLLETTPLESISFENSGVVAIYLKAIMDDLSMWRRSVFVDHSAEDIHYLDKTLFSSIAQLQITLSEGDESMTEEIEFF